MNKSFVLIYQDDSNDLHAMTFDTENSLREWVDNHIPTNKFVLVHGNINRVDTEMAC